MNLPFADVWFSAMAAVAAFWASAGLVLAHHLLGEECDHS
jgi:hypothetical protein